MFLLTNMVASANILSRSFLYSALCFNGQVYATIPIMQFLEEIVHSYSNPPYKKSEEKAVIFQLNALMKKCHDVNLIDLAHLLIL